VVCGESALIILRIRGCAADSSLHCTYLRQHWAGKGDKVVFWRVCFYFVIGLFVHYALLLELSPAFVSSAMATSLKSNCHVESKTCLSDATSIRTACISACRPASASIYHISTTRSPNSTKLHTSHPEMVDSKSELSKWKEHVCRDSKYALVHRNGPGPPAIFLPTTSPPTKDPGPHSSVATTKRFCRWLSAFQIHLGSAEIKTLVFFPRGTISVCFACAALRLHSRPASFSCVFRISTSDTGNHEIEKGRKDVSNDKEE
jgi:hypothetical protein